MRVQQYTYSDRGWFPELPDKGAANWLLVFGRVSDAQLRQQVLQAFPEALICGCSTSGEILGEEVYDDSLTVTAISFEKNTSVQACDARLAHAEDSRRVGHQLAQALLDDQGALSGQPLRHVFVLSTGLNVNGSDLVAGMNELLPESVVITGGLSGDGDRFEITWQWLQQDAHNDHVMAVGLYGEHLSIAHGSLGGWDSFGPDRKVTCSEANVLYELDNQSALALYKQYLGEYAKGLPASGLLFPLSISGDQLVGDGLVRTILAIDEEQQSMTFAGDIPEGCYARLMKANVDHLVEGAHQAAERCLTMMCNQEAELAILISCVGRKMVLKQRVEEEIETVRSVLGDKPSLTGFYSYGEISPLQPEARCALHNQTMTITTFAEC